MKEDKDKLMEGLWMLYQVEAAFRNISIEQFCINNDVSYNESYKWYKSMHYGVYQMQIDGRLDNIKATILMAIPSKVYQINPHAESVHEVYTSDGKQVLMSEDTYELYKHQRINDMEFNYKISPEKIK